MFAGRPHDCLPGVDALYFAILPGHPAAARDDMKQLPQARRMAAEDTARSYLRDVDPEFVAGSDARSLSHVHGTTAMLSNLPGIEGNPFHGQRL